MILSREDILAGTSVCKEWGFVTAPASNDRIFDVSHEVGKGKTMKSFLLLAVSIFLYYSCAPITSVEDIEKKRVSGNRIGVFYKYNWEEVYDAIKFVWSNSEVFPVSLRYRDSVTDYARKERAIWIRLTGERSIDMGIFLEPHGASGTYVDFVEGDPPDYWRSKTFQYLVDESKFFLENGEEAYRKYTHEQNQALKNRLEGPP